MLEDVSQRKNIRLKGYDYSQNGYYFITICTQNRLPLFGQIVGAIHESPLPKRSLLSQMIGYFKMNTTKQIHDANKKINVWQRGYYDHIIRNEKEYEKIWEYIQTNPLKWEADKYFT
jgi:REP element-mobilizing transposase RayT